MNLNLFGVKYKRCLCETIVGDKSGEQMCLFMAFTLFHRGNKKVLTLGIQKASSKLST
jgi:hypothetical protein